MHRRRERGSFGLLLLGAQIMRMGVHNIPPVTLATVALQVAIFLQLGDLGRWFGPTMHVCMSSYKVWYQRKWSLLILAALSHADDIHLYYNMASMLWKGRILERKFKSIYFAFLLVVFTVLTSITYVALNILLARVFDDSSYEMTCAVGFSGVLFALKVLISHYSPQRTQYVMGIVPIPSTSIFWAELILIQLITPHVSFTGHLAGILVGLLYIKGPLKTIMDSFVPTEPSHTYNAGRSGYSTGYYPGHGTNTGYRSNYYTNTSPGGNAPPGYQDHTHYTGGLSEEEQIRRATEESLQQNRGGNQDRLYPDLDDLRQRRQNRYT